MARLTRRQRHVVAVCLVIGLVLPVGAVAFAIEWFTSPDCGWRVCVEPEMREIAEEAHRPDSATELWAEFSGSAHDDSVFTVAYRVREPSDEVRPSSDWRWVDDPDADWGTGWRSGDCALDIAHPGDDGYVAPGGEDRMRVPERTFVVAVYCPWSVE